MKRKLNVHSSKIIQDEIKKQNDRIIQRLLDVKSSISIEKPKKFQHLEANLKKIQLEESKLSLCFIVLAKYTEVERENRILLEKMQGILGKKANSQNRSVISQASIH